MKTIYIIELHPTTKIYLCGFHCGHIIESASITDAIKYESYDSAQNELKRILDCKTETVYYISIVKYIQMG